MKRFAWLALPLLLCALVWGVKWRADHPTPTKLDLEVRALMLKSVEVEFSRYSHAFIVKNWENYHILLSKEEMKPFIDCFHLTQKPNITNENTRSRNGSVSFACPSNEPQKFGIYTVTATIIVDEREGRVELSKPTSDGRSTHNLHPITVKRWLELLFAHPKIGPELRRRMKQ